MDPQNCTALNASTQGDSLPGEYSTTGMIRQIKSQLKSMRHRILTSWRRVSLVYRGNSSIAELQINKSRHRYDFRAEALLLGTSDNQELFRQPAGSLSSRYDITSADTHRCEHLFGLRRMLRPRFGVDLSGQTLTNESPRKPV